MRTRTTTNAVGVVVGGGDCCLQDPAWFIRSPRDGTIYCVPMPVEGEPRLQGILAFRSLDDARHHAMQMREHWLNHGCWPVAGAWPYPTDFELPPPPLEVRESSLLELLMHAESGGLGVCLLHGPADKQTLAGPSGLPQPLELVRVRLEQTLLLQGRERG